MVTSKDTFQFLVTLKTLDPLFAEKKKENIQVLMIDNIGAFFHIDRYLEEKGGFGFGGGGGFGGFGGGGGGGGGGGKKRHYVSRIVSSLRALLNLHNLILFVTKPVYYGHITRRDLIDASVNVSAREYMGEQWERFVRYRVMLLKERKGGGGGGGGGSGASGLGGPYAFYACWTQPAPTAAISSAASPLRPAVTPQHLQRSSLTRKLIPFAVTDAGVMVL